MPQKFVLLKRAPAFSTALFFIIGAAIAVKTYSFPSEGNFFGPQIPTYAIAVILLISLLSAALLFGFGKNAVPAALTAILFLGFLMAQTRIERGYAGADIIEHTRIEGRVAAVEANGASSISVKLEDVIIKGVESQDISGNVKLIIYGQSAAYLQSEYSLIGSMLAADSSLMYPMGAADYGFSNERLSFLADDVAYKSLAHYSAVEITQYHSPGALMRVVAGVRLKLFGRIERYIGGQDAAFYIALLTGDKSALDMSVKTSFASLGLSHLLATSGLHIGILLIIFGTIFRRLHTPIALKSILNAVIILIFLCIAGFRVSMVRASLMWIVLTLNQLLGERLSPLNSLGCAMLVLMLINPLCIFDVSFVLSCASVAGIVLFSDIMNTANKAAYGRKALLLILTSVAVVTFTWPIAAYYFNAIPVMSPLYNLIFVPMSSVALFLGMLFGGLSGIGFLAPILGGAAKALSYLILEGSAFLSGFSPALNIVSPPFIVIVAWLGGAAMFSPVVFSKRGKSVSFAAGGIMCAACIMMAIAQAGAANEQAIKAYTDGSGMLIYMKDRAQNALIVNDDSYIAYNILKKDAAKDLGILIYSGDSDEELGEAIDGLGDVSINTIYAADEVAKIYNEHNDRHVVSLDKITMLGHSIELLPFKAKSKDAKTHYAAHIFDDRRSVIYIDALALREGAFENMHFTDAVCAAWSKRRAENISYLDFDSLYVTDASIFKYETVSELEREGVNIYNITQGTAEIYRGEGD